MPVALVGIEIEVRRLFAHCSGFYGTKGRGIREFCDVLEDYDLCMDIGEGGGCDKKTDRKLFAICDSCGAKVGCAVIDWRACEDAPRYEFAGYIA